MEIVVFIILGFFAGISSGLFGIGGGTVIVPSLILYGYPITFAIGISMMQMIFVSFFGSYLNYKKGLIELKKGIFLGIGGLFGASFSGIILTFASAKALYIAFFSFTFLSFYKYFFSKKTTYLPKTSTPAKTYLILISAGAFVGVFSASLGVGGGLLLAPILGYYLGLNSKQIVPLALFFICFSSVSGAVSLYIANFIHIKEGTIIGVASAFGVYCGITLLQRLSTQIHKTLLFIIYLLSILITLSKIL